MSEVFIIPKREVVRSGGRWIIYLPIEYGDVWRELKKQGRKVRVYIEVLDPEAGSDSSWLSAKGCNAQSTL